MPSDRWERLTRIAERLGIASLICGVLLWGAWEAAAWAGENVIKPTLAEHLEIIRVARNGIERNTEAITKLSACQERQDRTLSRISRTLEHVLAPPARPAVPVEPRPEPPEPN